MTSGSSNSASRRLPLIKMFHVGAVLLISLCRVSAADAPAVALTEFIYESAPFPECHASTIAETTNGQLIAAWFGGTEEKDPDVGIWVSRRVEGKWTEPVEVANGVQSAELRYPTWNPVLFQSRGGPLMLFFKVGPDPRNWWGEWMTSDDGGRSWKGRQKLPADGIGPVKNKPVQLADGTIWCPSSTEGRRGGHMLWQVHFEVTDAKGKSWRRTDPLNTGRDLGAIQPSLLTHADGRWQILARNRDGNGDLWTSFSSDQGQTWTPLNSAGLPNPNAGTDAVTLDDGRQLLVYNHTHRGQSFPRGREMLNVAVSDDGKTWQAALVLERSKGEYSYPAVIQDAAGLVHITYTWKRARVRHVVVDPKRLTGKPIVDGQWPDSIPHALSGG